jgi:hypothetical protein
MDHWHPDGSLLETYGPRMIYDAGSHLNARMFIVIRDKIKNKKLGLA